MDQRFRAIYEAEWDWRNNAFDPEEDEDESPAPMRRQVHVVAR
jgi:hypothetical protein